MGRGMNFAFFHLVVEQDGILCAGCLWEKVKSVTCAALCCSCKWVNTKETIYLAC